MKYRFLLPLVILLAGSAARGAAPANPATPRLGVYDSRIVAFAHFWSPECRQHLNERMAAGKAAKASGDQATYDLVAREMKESQSRLHLQVFSTAPIDDVLATMGERLAAVKKEAGVAVIVSKWDEAALRQHPGAEQVDVTELLIQPFQPDERRRKTIEEMKKKAPLPLEKARRLDAAGKM